MRTERHRPGAVPARERGLPDSPSPGRREWVSRKAETATQVRAQASQRDVEHEASPTTGMVRCAADLSSHPPITPRWPAIASLATRRQNFWPIQNDVLVPP